MPPRSAQADCPGLGGHWTAREPPTEEARQFHRKLMPNTAKTRIVARMASRFLGTSPVAPLQIEVWWKMCNFQTGAKGQCVRHRWERHIPSSTDLGASQNRLVSLWFPFQYPPKWEGSWCFHLSATLSSKRKPRHFEDCMLSFYTCSIRCQPKSGSRGLINHPGVLLDLLGKERQPFS